MTTLTQERPINAAARHRDRNGAEILVEALVHQGVEHVFAYPGGGSMPLHRALEKNRDKIRTLLPRHEQGGGFAAQGIARSTGKVGVCMATRIASENATRMPPRHRAVRKNPTFAIRLFGVPRREGWPR